MNKIVGYIALICLMPLFWLNKGDVSVFLPRQEYSDRRERLESSLLKRKIHRSVTMVFVLGSILTLVLIVKTEPLWLPVLNNFNK